MNGDAQKLSQACRDAIDQASNGSKLRISAISVWEVGMLEMKGRIRLSKSCLDWVQEALSAPGTHLLPLPQKLQ